MLIGFPKRSKPRKRFYASGRQLPGMITQRILWILRRLRQIGEANLYKLSKISGPVVFDTATCTGKFQSLILVTEAYDEFLLPFLDNCKNGFTAFCYVD